MNDAWAVYTIIGLLAAILAVLLYIAVQGSRRGGDWDGWPEWVSREPARIRAAIVAIVGAMATLLASFGVNMTDEQQAGIIGLIVAVSFAVAELTRRKVTPVQ